MENGDFEFDIWVPRPKSKVEEGMKNKKKVNFENKNKFEALQGMDVDDDEEGDVSMLKMVFSRPL